MELIFNKQNKRPVYETLLNNEQCLLHAESNLDNPEYLCFKEIQSINSKYLEYKTQ